MHLAGHTAKIHATSRLTKSPFKADESEENALAAGSPVRRQRKKLWAAPNE